MTDQGRETTAVGDGQAVANEQLLASAAAAHAAGSGRTQRRQQAMRDIAIALARDPVLVAVRGGDLVFAPGPDVVWVFTDIEAAAAWADAAHPAAAPCSFQRSDARNGGSPPDRDTWLAWLSSAGARSVAINAAGPVGLLLAPELVRTVRPRRVTRRVTAEHPWLDLDERRRERARIAELRGRLAAAVADPDPVAFDRIRPELDGANRRFGSPLWSAELHYLGGQGLIRSGSDRQGVVAMFTGIGICTRLGDLHRAIDGILELGGQLLAAPSPRSEWQITYLNELGDLLRRIRTDYRDDEVQQLLDAAEYAR